MYAVIRTGGKQYRVEPGESLRVEKLAVDPGGAVSFDALLVADGEKVAVGRPTVPGVKVEGEVVRHGRGKKIVVFKLRRRKNYRRKKGHRQPFTEVKVTGIVQS